MKARKIISTLCAVTMLFSAVSFASAAEKEPVSECAGQTIQCQVVEMSKDGSTSRVIEVAIPEGATEAQVNELVNNAALGVTARSVRATDQISVMQDVTIPVSTRGMVIGGGILERNYKRIIAQFIVSSHAASATLWAKCENVTTGESTAWEQVELAVVNQRIVFVASDIRMDAGDEIEIKGKSQSSAITTGVVYVAGSTVDG